MRHLDILLVYYRLYARGRRGGAKMSLKRVKYVYVDDDGKFIADLEGGQRSIIGLTQSMSGEPAGGEPV